MRKLLAGLLGLGIVACAISEPQHLLAAPKKPPASAPKFTIADATCAEGAEICRVTITKTGTARSASVVRVRTANNTAIAGTDFVSFDQDVSFSKNTSSVQVELEILADQAHEGSESFRVNMSAASNANIVDNQAFVTITDDDVAAPTTQICADGSVIPIEDECEETPPIEEPPPTGWVQADSLAGATGIASNFDSATSLRSLTAIADVAPTEVVGAFRFVCGMGQLSYNDPIVYPGQEGASHLHQFYGNLSANHNSTYASLRASGGSTCNDYSNQTTAANRSGYWMPAMLDGKGNVVNPNYAVIYYKRAPSGDATRCAPSLEAFQAGSQWGVCVVVPNGLRFVFGYDMLTGQPPTGALYYNCKDGTPGIYPNIPAAKANCPVGSSLLAIINAPECWDGKHLDSPNHRDHVSFRIKATGKCPSTHPYLFAKFTLTANYPVHAGDDLDLWELSSDDHARMSDPTLANGESYHADYFEAWDPAIKQMWHDNCIDLKLTCTAGDLGNLKQLIGAYAGRYLINGNLTYSFTNPTHLTPIPTDPTP